ncbi:copper resistance protein CopC/CopD [Jatrophihabitans telluris]|uniref:Copper resistance protein CopC/CopD n=1 Tax=Jatrophihabitans telluris TaxID=2038343 RepID=A0ABY4QTM3_9ACTN|nr:copper resistance protein CopC [Jatrophihabitans telluris]UQX87020.1 copper resistance protein CopC/CopD [Jatrophihabitans telluris]
MLARIVGKLGLLAAALLAALVVQIMFSPVSQAHSVLLSSTPQDGQVLASAPASIRLQFSEAVDPAFTQASVVDSQGRAFTPTSTALVGDAVLVLGLPPLPDETYRVSWRTVATDDRHQTSGVVVFGIGVSAAVGPTMAADPFPNASETLLRWLTLLGLSALTGGLLLSWLPRFGRVRLAAPIAGTLTRVSVVGGACALAAMLALAILQAGGTAALIALRTAPFGQRSAIRVLATVVLLLAALGHRRITAIVRVRYLAGAVELGVLATVVGTTALLGHDAGSPSRVIIGSVHLVFALAWCGSLIGSAVTAAALCRGRRADAEHKRQFLQLLKAFGTVAIACVAILAVTGVLLTGSAARTVDALLLSTYGHVLLIKLSLALAGGLLGWSAHRLLRRAHPTVRPRALMVEAVMLVLVLGGGAALAGTTPPQGSQWRPAVPVAGSVTVSGETAGLVESVRIAPNRPGHNFVTVGVFDSRRPVLGPISQVWIELTGPGGQHVQNPATSSSGQWVLPTDALDVSGIWSVQVRVARDGQPAVSTQYRWAVGGTVGGPARRVFSQLPMSAVADAVTAGLVLVLLVGLALTLRRRVKPAARLSTSAPLTEDDPQWEADANTRTRQSV